MLAIIDFEGDKDSDKNYRYGTYRFEYIWEKMIDKVFGIENKADYFPKQRGMLMEVNMIMLHLNQIRLCYMEQMYMCLMQNIINMG